MSYIQWRRNKTCFILDVTVMMILCTWKPFVALSKLDTWLVDCAVVSWTGRHTYTSRDALKPLAPSVAPLPKMHTYRAPNGVWRFSLKLLVSGAGSSQPQERDQSG